MRLVWRLKTWLEVGVEAVKQQVKDWKYYFWEFIVSTKTGAIGLSFDGLIVRESGGGFEDKDNAKIKQKQ